MNRLTPLTMIFIMIIVLTGCEKKEPQTSESGAVQAKVSEIPIYRDGKTYEQWAIDRRIQVTNDPTKIMWLHLLNMEGKPVQRMTVRCKTVSSGKRLYPTTVTQLNGNSGTRIPTYGGHYTNELMKPDGTYGHSEPFKYWFDPTGRYHELGGSGGSAMSYLLTDYPIDLEDPLDKITGMYEMDKVSWKWQQEQEARLKAEEERQKAEASEGNDK